MLEKWSSVAVLTAFLFQPAGAKAQYIIPMPVGATRLPDPMPVRPSAPQPQMISGPIGPDLAPPGPPNDLALPASHTSAFQFENFASHMRVQTSAGAMALRRQRLGHNFITFADPAPVLVPGRVNIPVDGTITLNPGFTPSPVSLPIPSDVFFTVLALPDDGRDPSASSSRLGDFHDINMPLAWGMRAGVMVFADESAVELSGFYLPKQGASTTVVSPSQDSASLVQSVTVGSSDPVTAANPFPPIGFPPGSITDRNQIVLTGDPRPGVQAAFGRMFSQLNIPFANAPAGFEGNNNLWRQADATVVRYDSLLWSVEANTRFWRNAGGPFEGILGVRYFNQEEELQHSTVDDYFQDLNNNTVVFNPSGVPNVPQSGLPARLVRSPVAVATYATRTKNRLFGANLGLEGHIAPFNWLVLGYTAKATVGVNMVDTEVSLTRGGGLVAYHTHDTHQRIGHAYDLGVSADIAMLEGARLHVGYNLMWLENVVSAYGVLDYNLANTHGNSTKGDSIFYHGPQIELQFLF